MPALRRISKFLINSLKLEALPGPFFHHGGHCWAASLPQHVAKANQYLLNYTDVCHRSPLVVYEDGVPLGPAHISRAGIRDVGSGRFTHWYDQLLFSTSDNTDPNTNGRRYTYSLSPWLFERRAGRSACAGEAVDGQASLGGPIERNGVDVASAIRLARQFLAALWTSTPSPAGKTALEIGPGGNCGTAMVLACYGLRVVVTDRILAVWNSDYHGGYYRALADELVKTDPTVDVAPLRALIAAGSHDTGAIQRIAWHSGEIALPSSSIDLVFSNGVIEHLEDIDTVARELYRITRPGGLHWHQIHCHDHRDMQRPLEYLLLADAEFQELFRRCHGECGNRLRPKEMTARFAAAGFEVLAFDADTLSRFKYADDLLPRLRGAQRSRYCELDVDELRVIIGICRARKPVQ